MVLTEAQQVAFIKKDPSRQSSDTSQDSGKTQTQISIPLNFHTCFWDSIWTAGNSRVLLDGLDINPGLNP